MDRRLLLFVVSMSVTLFFVNMYFQHQRDEELKTWNEARVARNELKIQQLEGEILNEKIPSNELSTIEIFSDSLGKHSLGRAYLDDDKIIYFTAIPPELIYIKDPKEPTKFEKFGLEKIQLLPSAHLYSNNLTPFKVGDLPDFGQFNLQLLTFDPLLALPAHFVDGNFVLLQDQVAKLKDLNPPLFDKDGIILFKVENQWLPVGLYEGAKRDVQWLHEIPALETVKITPQGSVLSTLSGKPEEQFYLLENAYLQLVFSTYGGALSEINLPFQTESNPLSVVKEIDIDREMVKEEPQNALFPSHSFFTFNEKAEGPFLKHTQGHLGGYYPLIRRDVIGSKGEKIMRVSPNFYALNLVSEYPELAELAYEVKSLTKNQITFEAKQSNRKITKTFTLADDRKGGPYCFDVSVKIEGDNRGLWIVSGVPEVEWISGGPAPALKYRITRNQRSDMEPIDLPQETITMSSINPDWVCNSNGFFGLIIDPLSEIGSGLRANYVPGTQVPSRLVEIDRKYDLYPAAKMPGYNLMLPLKQTPSTMQFRVFAGPFATDILKQVDAVYADPETGYNPDYISCQTFHGWFAFISEPFAKFLFFLMRWFYYLTGSWGLSIILLTVALRVMLFPLNAWSLKSTIKMQQIAPDVKALQEKYKKEPQKLQLEMMNLYRERGVNPVSGCLPLLIQMPFLIGMFDLLKSTFELRGASFIPGWINDLSAPDVLFTWNYPIFFIGNEFHLLPFILGGVMFLQQRMMATTPSDPNEMTEQQRQQRAMGNIMTVVFTLMFYNFPSGLNIYWLSSMILGMMQQWWTNKLLTPKLGAVRR